MVGMRRFLRSLLTVCIVGAPCLATAQSIYKVQMPDGSILFTDTPPAEAKILEERSAKVTPRPATSSAAARPPSVANAPVGGTPAPRVESSINVASAAVSTAERELAVARRALELGREPLPGESGSDSRAAAPGSRRNMTRACADSNRVSLTPRPS